MCRKRKYVKFWFHTKGRSSTNLLISTANSGLLFWGGIKGTLQILIEMLGLAFEVFEDRLGQRRS